MYLPKKLSLLLLLTFSVATAQNDFFIIEKTFEKASNQVKKNIKSKGYKIKYDLLINDHFVVEKGKKRSLANRNGDVIGDGYEYLTRATKQNMFFTGEPYNSRNDYGKIEASRYENIRTYNLQGQEIKTEINEYANYFFARNQVMSSNFYTSSKKDYITIHQTTDGKHISGATIKVQKEGIMDGSGKIILHPKYNKIKQIHEDYFLVIEDKVGKIINLSNLNTHSIPVEDIMPHPKLVQRHNEPLFFNSNIIVQSNGKYGIYNLETKKWTIPNAYDKIEPIAKSIQPDGKSSSKHKKVVFTDVFIAKKDDLWGVIDGTNKITVPFNFSKVTYLNPITFTVYNSLNKKNRFDISTQKEVVAKYYDDLIIYNLAPEKAIVKEGENYGLLNISENTFIIPLEEGHTKYEHFNGQRHLVFLKPNPESKNSSDSFFHTIYATKTDMIIGKGYRDVSTVSHHKAWLVGTSFENKRSIIDSFGKEIVAPASLKGKAIYNHSLKKIIFGHHSKKNEIYHCYDLEGNVVKTKKCR